MKKFKIFRLLSIVAIAAAGIFGAVNFKSSKKVEETSATSSATKHFTTKDGYLYYLAYWNDGWTGSNAKIWCYFWDDSGHYCWTPTCINTDDNLIEYKSNGNMSYYIVKPENTSYTWNHAKFHRYDSSSVSSRNTYWNKTADATLGNSYNVIAPYGTSDNGSYNVETYTARFFEAGETYYMDLSQGSYDWVAANHKIYGHLYTSAVNETTSAIDVQLTRVLGFSNIYLYQMVVPSDNDYFRLILHRGTTPSGYTNQTAALYRDASNNVFKLNSYTTGTWDWNLSNSDRANYYGIYFLDQITCSGSGSITSTSTNWTNVTNEYNNLSKTIQGIVWTSSAAASGTDLVRAMYRYDYIVFHKGYSGYNDFINRATSSGKSFSNPNIVSLLFTKNINTNLIPIVIISIVGVATIGGYFFYKKRKENF